MAILDASPGNFSLGVTVNNASSRLDCELALCRERSLLHVAVSRAKRHLVLCTRTEYSPFLKPVLDTKTTETAPD